MRCVGFAAQEPNLYRLLFLSRREEHSPYTRFKEDFGSIFTSLVEEIQKNFGLSRQDAEELLNQMIIFANGIAAFVITDPGSFSREAVSRHLSQVCMGVVLGQKLRGGSLDLASAQALANSYDMQTIPRKKSGENR